MTTYLAIDYGTKRIGLAYNVGSVALPAGIIPVERIFDVLPDVLQKYNIQAFVIGEANHVSGEISATTRLIQDFVAQLQDRFPTLPIMYHDERFSSFEARSSLANFRGTTNIPQKKKEQIDDIAASIILQSYIDSHPAS